MRVPIPVVILLCLGMVAGVWWHGTARYDFLTPPPDTPSAAAIPTPLAEDPAPPPRPVLVKPAKPAPVVITLHAGTAKRTADLLTPVMHEIAGEISRVAGSLVVAVRVNVGSDIAEEIGPPPVAIWLSGAAEDAPGTGVISFTLDDPARARDEVLTSVLKLIDGFLKTSTTGEMPATGEPIADFLRRRIPAETWRDLANRLNPALPPHQPINPNP